MSTTFTGAEAFPAGEFLRDELEARDWTVTEFAEIIGRPIQAVSEILNGKKEITVETACEFAAALGTSPDLWLNLQTNYRLYEARRDADENLGPVARKARLRNLIPLTDARARGWIYAGDELDVLEDSVRDFLGIDSLDDTPELAVAARRSNSDEPISPEQTAWLAHVRAVGRTRETGPFDVGALRELAPNIARFARSATSDIPTVLSRLSECGVAVVISEGLRGGKLDGAVTFTADRPVIGLTARGNRFDSLLFTLLHECAHLTLGHITPDGESILDDDVKGEQTDKREIEANDQAAEWIFPGGIESPPRTTAGVLREAERYQVHPSMVIGHVQHKTQNWRFLRSGIAKVREDLERSGVMS